MGKVSTEAVSPEKSSETAGTEANRNARTCHGPGLMRPDGGWLAIAPAHARGVVAAADCGSLIWFGHGYEVLVANEPELDSPKPGRRSTKQAATRAASFHRDAGDTASSCNRRHVASFDCLESVVIGEKSVSRPRLRPCYDPWIHQGRSAASVRYQTNTSGKESNQCNAQERLSLAKPDTNPPTEKGRHASLFFQCAGPR